MSKVYTVNGGESGANQIPSIEYLNEIIKMIDDRFKCPNVVTDGFPSIKMKIEELPIGIKEQSIIAAKDIKTDSQHKFINEAILDTMIDKPTKFEMEQSLNDTKSDLIKYMDDIYMRIINTPNIINKLRDISTILNEDEISAGLLNTLAYKLNFEDFKEHNESSIHMNNNDRKALNVLIKCIISGFADWNAEDGACNAIKNKPESLPANGGNADTVSNHNIRDLINKDDYDVVIGTSFEKYSKDSCDIYAEEGRLNDDVIENAIESIKGSGIILFKRGYYNLNHLFLDYSGTRIINGADCRLSWIHVNEAIFANNSVFKNIAFDKSRIFIKSNCEFKDVKFANCTIVFDSSVGCKITDCAFDKCVFEYEGSIMNNIIKFNRYIQTKPIVYIGGNNIISDNI